jgi:hypothetical protein
LQLTSAEPEMIRNLTGCRSAEQNFQSAKAKPKTIDAAPTVSNSRATRRTPEFKNCPSLGPNLPQAKQESEPIFQALVATKFQQGQRSNGNHIQSALLINCKEKSEA